VPVLEKKDALLELRPADLELYSELPPRRVPTELLELELLLIPVNGSPAVRRDLQSPLAASVDILRALETRLFALRIATKDERLSTALTPFSAASSGRT
jgi:hypothetical protein